jgi:hypothetical protein
LGLRPLIEPVPTGGTVGEPVTVLGTNLAGITGVRFDGQQAPFVVVSATEILTVVPAGAQTGFVTVDTPSGTLKSAVKFVIVPSACAR